MRFAKFENVCYNKKEFLLCRRKFVLTDIEIAEAVVFVIIPALGAGSASAKGQ